MPRYFIFKVHKTKDKEKILKVTRVGLSQVKRHPCMRVVLNGVSEVKPSTEGIHTGKRLAAVMEDWLCKG